MITHEQIAAVLDHDVCSWNRPPAGRDPGTQCSSCPAAPGGCSQTSIAPHPHPVTAGQWRCKHLGAAAGRNRHHRRGVVRHRLWQTPCSAAAWAPEVFLAVYRIASQSPGGSRGPAGGRTTAVSCRSSPPTRRLRSGWKSWLRSELGTLLLTVIHAARWPCRGKLSHGSVGGSEVRSCSSARARVRVVTETGKPIAQVARDQGSSEGTMETWMSSTDRLSHLATG